MHDTLNYRPSKIGAIQFEFSRRSLSVLQVTLSLLCATISSDLKIVTQAAAGFILDYILGAKPPPNYLAVTGLHSRQARPRLRTL